MDSMMMGPPRSQQSGPLQIHGERTSGNDVRQQNVTAVVAVANIVKSSLGPVGLDKVRSFPDIPGSCAVVGGMCCRCCRGSS